MAELKLRLKQENDHFDRTFGLDQQKLGADLLKTGAEMRGPLNFVQGDMYAQGVANGGLSPFIAALQGGTTVPYGGGTATGGSPTPLTVGTLAQAMGGGGSQGASRPGAGGVDAYGRPALSPGVQQAVDAGRATFESGLANKGLGFMENMSPRTSSKALTSIGDYIGRNTGSEYEYYKRSPARSGLGAGGLVVELDRQGLTGRGG
jgi:hypothetical protein